MKNSFSSHIRIAVILLIFLPLFSCIYKHYTGRYWIGKTSQTFVTGPASDEDNNKILIVIRYVTKEFGFVENKRLQAVPDVVTFGKSEKAGTKYNMLDGSDAQISIVFITGSSPSILIQDLSYVEETEFMKIFKSQLETRLNEVVDMKGVRFIREFDFL